MKAPCGLEYKVFNLWGNEVTVKPCKMLQDTDVYVGSFIQYNCETCKYNEELFDAEAHATITQAK